MNNKKHIILTKRCIFFILSYYTFFVSKLYSSVTSYFWYWTILPIKCPQLHHCNAESVFLPHSLLIQHKSFWIHLHYWNLRHPISTAAALLTAPFYHADSSSLPYYPAPSLFCHQILHCCHIICTSPYVTSTIQALTLIYSSSNQWNCLPFIWSTLNYCCFHYPHSSAYSRIKPYPRLLYLCVPVTNYIYYPPHNLLPPYPFIIIQIRLIFVSISCVHPPFKSFCIPQDTVIHCPAVCVQPQVKWCTNNNIRAKNWDHWTVSVQGI